MKVIYQGVNPRKTKRRNPEDVVYAKGGKKKTVTEYSPSERAELIKSKKAISDAIKSLESQSINGSSRQINLLRKAKDKSVNALKKRSSVISGEIEKLKNARAERLQLSYEGYAEKSKKVSPLRKDLTHDVNKKIVSGITRGSAKFGSDNVSKLEKSAKLRAHKMAKKNELLTVQNKLKKSEEKLKELKHLRTHGASEQDKTDLAFTKAEISELKKQLVSKSKGVVMAEKKVVAKKATKEATKKVAKTAKKATRKVAKKAGKKVAKKASKASKKPKSARRKKAKKVIAPVVVAKPKRRKAHKGHKTVKAKAKKAKKVSKKVSKKSNPMVVRKNPYVRSNPMLTKVDSILDRVLGVSTVELGGVLLASSIDGLVISWVKKIPHSDKVLAHIPSEYHAPLVNGLLGALLVGAEHICAKKKIKAGPYLGDIGRGFLLVSLVKGMGQLSPESEENTLAGYVSEATPRSMGGYVLERNMGDVDFGNKEVDFQGSNADFQGTSEDFQGMGSMHDDFDLDQTDW
jgi:hypothetical protein